jgi:phosphatidylglycerol:prolipoprotein diacylglycerol transferase
LPAPDILLGLGDIAFDLALGQAIGRWGSAPERRTVQPALGYSHRSPPASGLPECGDHHPIPLNHCGADEYGSFALVGSSLSDRLKSGDIFLTYLIIYPLGRFLLEFLRLDASLVAGLNANQTVMAIVALTAAAVLYWRHRKPPAA